jgi:hypothetical protein
MAITKYRIWAPPVNRFTVAARAVSQCGRTSDGWSFAGLMEKIMSKTRHTPNLDNLAKDMRQDADLAAVTGGATAKDDYRIVGAAITAISGGLGDGVGGGGGGGGAGPAIGAWNQLLNDYGYR